MTARLGRNAEEHPPHRAGGTAKNKKAPLRRFRFWERVWAWTVAFGNSRFARLSAGIPASVIASDTRCGCRV